MYIIKNLQLDSIDLPLTSFYGPSYIQNNGYDLSIDLPALLTSSSLVISQCSRLNLPALVSPLNLEFTNNFFGTLSLPSVTSIGSNGLGRLLVQDNDALSNLSVLNLETVTWDVIENNPNLKCLTG